MADLVSDDTDLGTLLEAHRRDLTGHCYRMLGSTFEAEDAVQDTLVRAWRSYDRFEGRSSVKTWLHRIATNVCLDLLDGRNRRARPMELGPASTAAAVLGAPLGEATWVQPIPDGRALPVDGDPQELAAARESIRLAFVAALQHLPPKQRAVLILCEVLRWKAEEVADLLDTTVASVTSALQRARATLAERRADGSDVAALTTEAEEAWLARYVDAFERYDVEALTALLHEDATLSMPPWDLWIRGPVEIRRWWSGPGLACAGSVLLPTRANGTPAFGQYRPSGPGGRHEPFALQVLELEGDRIIGFNAFLDTATMFPLFGLPLTLDG